MTRGRTLDTEALRGALFFMPPQRKLFPSSCFERKFLEDLLTMQLYRRHP